MYIHRKEGGTRLKINEVEALVGVTKKNIRFYESEGLLTPHRNSENGYRDYGDAEVNTLRQIKLLRKLGVPLEEIRQMQNGTYTLGEGMRRHLATLAREQENLTQAIAVCAQLQEQTEPLKALNAAAVLAQMEQLEQEGTVFMDKQKNDRRKRYIGPLIAAIVMALLMVGCIWLFLWAFEVDPVGAPPLPLFLLLIAMPAAVIFGVVAAMILRFREIGKGEEEDARKY